MVPEMEHTPPRLGFKMRARPPGDTIPMKYPIFEKKHGRQMGVQNVYFCNLIAADYCLN